SLLNPPWPTVAPRCCGGTRLRSEALEGVTEAQRREDREWSRHSGPAPGLAPPGRRSGLLLGGKDDRGCPTRDPDEPPSAVSLPPELAERERPRPELSDRLPGEQLERGRVPLGGDLVRALFEADQDASDGDRSCSSRRGEPHPDALPQAAELERGAD